MANIVLVTKPRIEIKVCTNFCNINNAWPKDDFPLPNSDMILYSIFGHDTLSFMDGFLGYNQILINQTDREKTGFTTPWETFCWEGHAF